jgi:hypothetical protein
MQKLIPNVYGFLQFRTSLSYFGRNYDIMKSDINNDLSKLNEWAKLWLVDFNPKKTKALVISTSAVPHLDLRFNVCYIVYVE